MFRLNIRLILLLLLAFLSLHTTVFATSLKTKYFSMHSETSTISSNAQLCGYLPSGCNAIITGLGESNIFSQLHYSARISIAWQNSTANGLGGHCAPITGSAVLKDLEQTTDSLTISILGTVCDKGKENPFGNHKMSGTFIVKSGTGKYALATGSGILKGYDKKNKIHFSATGKLEHIRFDTKIKDRDDDNKEDVEDVSGR